MSRSGAKKRVMNLHFLDQARSYVMQRWEGELVPVDGQIRFLSFFWTEKDTATII